MAREPVPHAVHAVAGRDVCGRLFRRCAGEAARAVRLRRPLQYAHTDAVSLERRFTVVEPVGDSGWTLLVAQSYELVMARLTDALWQLAAVGALLALVCMLVVRKLARHVSQPVEGLSSAAARLGRGEYDMPVPYVARRDEVGQMARTLEHARGSIQQQLREIEDMTAARQKLESELSIAREIQQAMLPPGRVIDREQSHLEAYARLEPAKAVGGDFYSFIETGTDGDADAAACAYRGATGPGAVDGSDADDVQRGRPQGGQRAARAVQGQVREGAR